MVFDIMVRLGGVLSRHDSFEEQAALHVYEL